MPIKELARIVKGRISWMSGGSQYIRELFPESLSNHQKFKGPRSRFPFNPIHSSLNSRSYRLYDKFGGLKFNWGITATCDNGKTIRSQCTGYIFDITDVLRSTHTVLHPKRSCSFIVYYLTNSSVTCYNFPWWENLSFRYVTDDGQLWVLSALITNKSSHSSLPLPTWEHHMVLTFAHQKKS